MTDLSTPHVHAAAAHFLRTFNSRDLAAAIAPTLTCTEANALCALLRALGAPATADMWEGYHVASDTDEPHTSD